MEPFKIYDNLLKMMEKKNHTKEMVLEGEHRATINTLPMEHREILYAIILHYYKKHVNHNTGSEIPYKAKIGIGGKGVTFDTNNLPRELQEMIIEYIKCVK